MIDLRSDTVTKPGARMREAMASAEVGDDVFGEDPTVIRLQEHVAELLGKEDALFTPSGVMANQIAIRCHTHPGEEVILDRDAHVLNYETGAPAVISGVQLLTVPATRGVPDIGALSEAIRADAYYLPRTSLICLENTHNRAGGAIIPLSAMKSIHELATAKNVRIHLDGARLWNASVASGVHVKEYAAYADTVSVCFSKGLGAPVGSMIAGSKELIARARKVRKMLGGGMRQVGILAAAALYAVRHNIERLREDHENARLFARGVSDGTRGKVRCDDPETNIVLLNLDASGITAGEGLSRCATQGVMLTEAGPRTLRAVTHMDVARESVMKAATILAKVLG